MYGVGLGGDPTGLALEFFDAVEAMEIGLEGVLTEFSPGQMEINLTYGPALAAADAAQLVKEMTREVAARRGYRATYMGRPDAMSVGSGLHVNFSLVPVSGGANALPRPGAARRAEHARPPGDRRADRPPRGGGRAVGAADQQLQAADARADRRLLGELGPRQPLQHVPRAGRAGLGDAHREPHAVRHGQPVPGRGGDARTPRCSASSTAPTAATRRSATPTPRRTPTATRRTRSPRRSTPSRPTPCSTEAMGPDLVAAYLALRRHEVARWEAAGESWDPEKITAWELDSYLPVLLTDSVVGWGSLERSPGSSESTCRGRPRRRRGRRGPRRGCPRRGGGPRRARRRGR